MDVNRKKEIAKFLCGFEAAHALADILILVSGTTINILGIALTPTWHIVPLTVNILLTIALGNYGWSLYRRRGR